MVLGLQVTCVLISLLLVMKLIRFLQRCVLSVSRRPPAVTLPSISQTPSLLIELSLWLDQDTVRNDSN